MTESTKERRRFIRIAFDATTQLSQGEQRWDVKLQDLSLKGLLIERPSPWEGDPNKPFEVDIQLGDEEHVRMDVQQAHDDHNQLGFECLHISLESVSYLRRVIELNLGNPDELERELGALLAV